MAKKRAAGSQSSMGFEDTYPEPVQDAADAYIKALRAKNKAMEKCNSAKEVCIEKMQEHKCPRIRIDNGGKWLTISTSNSLKTEKIKEPGEED